MDFQVLEPDFEWRALFPTPLTFSIQVAEVAAEALLLPEASYKVVEVISKKDAPSKKLQDLFAAVPSVPH